MKLITSIKVCFEDDITKSPSSVELRDGKIVSTKDGVEKITEGRQAELICEQLNAMMGIAFSRLP